MKRSEVRSALLAYDAAHRKARGFDGRGLRYNWITAERDGEMTVSTWLVSRRRSGRPECTEVVRASTRRIGRVEMRNWAFTPIAGWRLVCGDGRWHSIEADWFPKDYDPLVNPEAIGGTRYARCGWTPGCGVPLMRYVALWREFPEVERLAKAGLGSLVNRPCVRRLARRDGFFRYVAQNRRLVASAKASSAVVTYGHAHGMPLADALRDFDAKRWLRMRGIVGVTAREAFRVRSWIGRHEIDCGEYARYLGYAREAGWDLGDRAVLLPPHERFRDRLEYAEAEVERRRRERERLDRRAEAERRRARSRTIREVASRFAAAVDARALRSALVVVMPLSRRDLVDEGKAMRNCLGRMGYDAKIAEGRSVVLFVRGADGGRVADVEIDRATWKVRQCYGPRNSRASDEAWRVAVAAARRMKRLECTILHHDAERRGRTRKEAVA